MNIIDIYNKEAETRTDIVRIELWVKSASLVRHNVGTTIYKMREWKIEVLDALDVVIPLPVIPTLFDSCRTTHAMRQGAGAHILMFDLCGNGLMMDLQGRIISAKTLIHTTLVTRVGASHGLNWD